MALVVCSVISRGATTGSGWHPLDGRHRLCHARSATVMQDNFLFRVAIARAILAEPCILILDEATSSLDSERDQMIQEGLRRLRAGRTTFVIAHRLSPITSADQILVLEHGERMAARADRTP